jgi:hypothetical protein
MLCANRPPQLKAIDCAAGDADQSDHTKDDGQDLARFHR